MRLLKIAGIVLGSLIVLIVIALLAVRLLVNPNDYKGRIAQVVRHSTGRELALPGQIKLSVFPWIALEFGPASLGNPPGFGTEPFASVQQVAVRVKLLPLLRGHLQIGRVDIDGLDLRLRSNAAGQGNWQGLGGSSAAPGASPASASSAGPAALPDLAGVVIRDSRLSYQGMVASSVNLSIGRVAAGVAIPVSVKLDLAEGGNARPIVLAGRFNVTLDPAAKRYQLSELDIQLDDSTLRGSAAITDLPTRASHFDLTLDHIDLDRYRAPEQVAPAVPGAPAAGRSAALPTDLLRTLNTSGSFALGSATVAGLQLTQLQLALMAQDGLVHLGITRAGLYGGQDTGAVTLDVRGAVPALMIDQHLTGVDVAALLKDFAHTQRLSGHGTLTASLTAHGSDADAWLGSLSGHVAADLAGGAIQGIDLGADINSAVSLLQKRSLSVAGGGAPSIGGGQTKFDTFKMSADLSRGVATTKDLVIGTQDLRITAQGTTNLVTRAIDYRAQAAILGAPAAATAGAKSASARTLADIPFTITGTLTSPAVRPDLQGMVKARAQQELEAHKAQLQQKLKGTLKGVLKGLFK